MPAGKFANRASRTPTRRRLLVGAGLFLSTATAGCLGAAGDTDAVADGEDRNDAETTGDSAEDDGPTQRIEVLGEEPVPEAAVSMGGGDTPRFGPQLVWIVVGGRVIWQNTDPDHDHDVASLPGRIPEDGSGWSTGLLRSGETYQRTFTEPGVYDYVCSPHAAHMVGRVIVGTPDIDEEPALSADGEVLSGEEARTVFAELNDRTRELFDDRAAAAGDTRDCDCPD